MAAASPRAAVASPQRARPAGSGGLAARSEERATLADGRTGRARPTAVLASVGDQPSENLPPERVDATPFDLGAAVDDVLAGAACTRVGVTGLAGGSVALSGMASTDAARTSLVDAVTSLPGAPTVNAANVLALPVPCVIMSFLDDLEDRRADAAVVSPNRRLPGAQRFEPWARLQLDMVTPKFPSFLMVDYFAADGKVYHLDSDNWPAGAFPPSRPVQFGGRGGIGVPVTLRPPPGREFLLVTASSEPIFDVRPLADPADAYVEGLRRGIDSALNAGVTLEILAAIIQTGTLEDEAQ